MMRRLGKCLAPALFLLLAACAVPKKIDHAGADASFQRSGRFALSVNYHGGKQDAVQGGFAWLDTGSQLKLDLANPLGSTLARVEVDSVHAVLTRTDGSVIAARHPDALVEQVLGSPIPVAGLRNWLQGRTGNHTVTLLEKNSDNQILSFSQDGWRVRLSRYDQYGPKLLQLNRHDVQRDISVRLVTD